MTSADIGSDSCGYLSSCDILTHFVALHSVMSLPDFPALHLCFVVMWQVGSKTGQQMTKAMVRYDNLQQRSKMTTPVGSDDHSRGWG